MLHTKYFEVLKQFLGNYVAEIYGRMLVGKVPLSQKAIALALAELEEKGVLRSRSQGMIKYYRLNLEHSEIKDVINMLEIERKMEFLALHRKLAHMFREDARVVGVFGSYAKNSQKEGSDVDVCIVGREKKGDYDKKGKLLDIDVSIKYFAPREWETLLSQKNNLVKEIVSHHVMIFGVESFVNTLWRHFYGIN